MKQPRDFGSVDRALHESGIVNNELMTDFVLSDSYDSCYELLSMLNGWFSSSLIVACPDRGLPH
jgi:hypothetical protein